MTHLSSPSQSDYEWRISWEQYLSQMVSYDPEDNTINISLDEEGNEWWDMNIEEAEKLAVHIIACVEALKKHKK